MPGLGFLFWNLNRQPLEERVARIAALHDTDIVCLAECPSQGSLHTSAFKTVGAGAFHEVEGSGTDLRVFSRLARRAFRFQFADPAGRWLVFRVLPGWSPEFLLTVVHLPSKLYVRDSTQSLTVRPLAADICRIEDRRGHRRTVLVGDLNMNPFEEGVAGAGGLHAVMDGAVAGRESRVIEGKAYRMFYNPMWALFGDRTRGPSGTYYRGAAEAVNYFWNTYDQVLVRPVMIPRLKEFGVLDSDGPVSLLTPSGLPDKASGSDHLPLHFRLEW